MPDIRQLVTTAAVAVLAIAAYQAVHDTSQAPAAAGPHQPAGMLQPFMRFTGSGQITMRPDQGTISFATHGTGATLVDAQNEASQAMRTLIRTLRADGVARSDMRTDGVSGSSRPSVGGFAADQSLQVTVRDLKQPARCSPTARPPGRTRCTASTSRSPTSTRPTTPPCARPCATPAAKADAVAAAAGMHVTGVVSVNETQQQIYPVYGEASRPHGRHARGRRARQARHPEGERRRDRRLRVQRAEPDRGQAPRTVRCDTAVRGLSGRAAATGAAPARSGRSRSSSGRTG